MVRFRQKPQNPEENDVGRIFNTEKIKKVWKKGFQKSKNKMLGMICMYERTYIRTYVRTYVRAYVRTYISTYVSRTGRPLPIVLVYFEFDDLYFEFDDHFR